MRIIASVATLLLAGAGLHAQTADHIWSGSPNLTMNDAALRAEAVAVVSGVILAGGSRSEVIRMKAPGAQLLDLEGRAVVPGFVDPDGHMMFGGLEAISANLMAAHDGEMRDGIFMLSRMLARPAS